MSTEAVQPQLSPLVNALAELAGEIDGIADLGITVCLLHEERMAGRHNYIVRQCDRIRHLVDAIGSLLNEAKTPAFDDVSALQFTLVADSNQLLNVFESLESFRSLGKESLRSSTDALRTAWESIHQTILAIAQAFHLLDESWYSPIRERQATYRGNLEHLFEWFQEAAAT